MKALVLKEYKQFAYEDVPIPQLGPRDVLVQVKACGMWTTNMPVTLANVFVMPRLPRFGIG